MFSRRIQQQARRVVTFIIRPLARLGITPNTLTVIGLLLSGLTALVIAQGFLFAGGLLVLFAGIFDLFDGAMARVLRAATTFGAFFDSTLDRYSESIILFGLLYYALQRPALHDLLWPFAHEQFWMIALIFMVVVGSLMVSYTKARAEGLGLECKTGLLARPERVVILAIGLLTGTVVWALVVLAVFSHVTALERIVHVWRITPREAGVSRVPAFSSDALANQQELSATDHHTPIIVRTSEPGESAGRSVPTGVPPFSGGVQSE
ncbi:MAG: CDP-alcohol phosphatidyltransferase family protein [Ktedonobacteraceae bacterium]|nr:CDP-alcohol phosphatidyltransferase family protein [Chloroflexota bacterium]